MSQIKLYLKFMLVSGLIFGIFFGIGAGLTSYMHGVLASSGEETLDDASGLKNGGRTNILVLGVDARPGDENSRSDTMMLISIDPKLDKAAVVSIPRDTKVEIKNSTLDKICAANFVGGPEYAVEVVEDLMGIAVDHYIEVDFNGFKKIIDTLGGVTIDVPQRMYKPSENINLYPGKQRLNGEQALAFVRYRDYAYGDIQRTAQQQEFIRALADEVLQAKTITKLPKLVKQVSEYVDTDLKVNDMLKMASWVPGFKNESIITQTLPGYFYDKFDDEGNLVQSYWISDKSQIQDLLDNMFAGKTVAVIQASPYPVTVPRVERQNEEEQDPGQGKQGSETGEEQQPQNNGEAAQDEYERNIKRSQLPSPGHDLQEPDSSGTGSTL